MNEEIKGKCYQEHEPTPDDPCEIKKMCNDIYEGGSWQPMIDLIKNKNKRIEELKAVRKGLSKVSVKRNKWKNRYYKAKRKNKQLKEVINKAIEYINNNYPLRTSFSKNIYDFKIELKKILTGDSNE